MPILFSGSSQPGTELAYAERSSDMAGNVGGAAKDVDGLTITVVAGIRPFMLELETPYLKNSTSGAVSALNIQEGATLLANVFAQSPAAGQGMPVRRGRRISDAIPGSTHTYKVVLLAFSGTPTIQGTSWLRAIEV